MLKDEFNIPGWDLTPVEDTEPAALAYFTPKADEYFATAAQPVLDTVPPEWAEENYEEDYCECPICSGQDEDYDGLDDGEAVVEEEENHTKVTIERSWFEETVTMVRRDDYIMIKISPLVGDHQEMVLGGELELAALRELLR